MSALEEAKRVAEKLTGLHRPDQDALSRLVRARTPNQFRFEDDGGSPNNPKWPLLIYPSPINMENEFDPAAVFEELFASNGWTDSWRNGIYDFLHFHTHRHEVLGIARGVVAIAFGGAKGTCRRLNAGDVAVLPAGTGHRRIDASDDLLVVGAYPQNSGDYDQPTPSDAQHPDAIINISKVPRPKSDPVYGCEGPLIRLWR